MAASFAAFLAASFAFALADKVAPGAATAAGADDAAVGEFAAADGTESELPAFATSEDEVAGDNLAVEGAAANGVGGFGAGRVVAAE